MSLNWDARKCTDAWKELDSNKQESLIFATMFVDIGEITEKNHEEFYLRYVQFSTACNQDSYLTLEDVTAAIGLSTNVFTTTTAAWRKRLVKIMEDRSRDKLYVAKRDAAKLAEEVPSGQE